MADNHEFEAELAEYKLSARPQQEGGNCYRQFPPFPLLGKNFSNTMFGRKPTFK